MRASSFLPLLLAALAANVAPAQVRSGDEPVATPTEAARVALRTRQFADALRALRPLAERGDADARYLLGLGIESGYLSDASLGDARRWLTLAAEQKHAAAAFALAGSWAHRDPVDAAQATRWLGIAADLGYPLAAELRRAGSLPLAAQRPDLRNDATLRRDFALRAARLGSTADLEAVGRDLVATLRDAQGRNLLANAAEAGQAANVQWLLAARVDPNLADSSGITALMLAATQPDVAVTRALLGAGATVNAADAAGRTALVHAAWADQAAQIEALAAAGATLDHVDARGWTALDIGIQRERPKAAAALRALGAHARAGDLPQANSGSMDPTRTGLLYANWSPLLVAVSRDDAAAVQRLLATPDGGARTTPQGDTALHVAIEYGATRSLPLLLAAGLDPFAANARRESAVGLALRRRDAAALDLLAPGAALARAPAEERARLLTAAAARGHADTTAWLVARGADANSRDAAGTPALQLAVASGDLATVRALLERDADSNATDARGRSALWQAAANGRREVVDLLLARRARTDAANRHGATPLMAAARQGHAAVVEALLAAGANASTADRRGDTALHAAASAGETAVLRLLMRPGTDLDRANAVGDTPLIAAARGGHRDCVTVLLKAGADAKPRNRDRLTARDVAELRGFSDLASQLAAR